MATANQAFTPFMERLEPAQKRTFRAGMRRIRRDLERRLRRLPEGRVGAGLVRCPLCIKDDLADAAERAQPCAACDGLRWLTRADAAAWRARMGK
jgi:hypothetical protein